MPSITIQSTGKQIDYETGGSLLEVLLAHGIFVDNPCNGKGVCGKCRVKILSEEVNEVSESEQKFLKDEELETGIRLSCYVKPEQDLVIELLQKEGKHEVLTGGYVPEFTLAPGITKKLIEIEKPTLSKQTPYEDQIREQLPVEDVAFDVIRKATFIPGVMTVVMNQGTVIGMEPGDTTGELYGVAIDIGTTTVVCSLVDMNSGKELAHESMINAQKHFGLDVLTRITYEVEHPEDGTTKLQAAIVDSINEMIKKLCKKTAISGDRIYEVTVAANCTMMHMILGVDATSIGKSPYAPIFTKAKYLRASDIGIQIAEGGRLYCLPSVSSYIGADIVAGAYVCQLDRDQGNTLFIDIGTNGEIVLSERGKLISCSCAAGPALEGMNITAGMRAAEGAIEDVVITEEGVELKVIGEKAPIGICGSGILAVVKELVKHGIITNSGAFIKKKKMDPEDYRYDMIQMNGIKREFILTNEPEQLLITQGDVRQVQLAKGAILSGFLALLQQVNLEMSDLDRVMIAGQFGAHLPADSLTGTGILPKEIEEKLVYVGNSSKTGAYMALLSEQVKSEMEELAKHMDYMELGATEGYERLFSNCLLF